MTGEIFVDQVELNTTVCHDGEGLAAALGGLRRWLTATGAPVDGGRCPPGRAFGTAHMACSARYEGILTELAGLFRTPTAALQVHVALPDPQTAMVAYRSLRNRLCLLRAVGELAVLARHHCPEEAVPTRRPPTRMVLPSTFPGATIWSGIPLWRRGAIGRIFPPPGQGPRRCSSEVGL